MSAALDEPGVDGGLFMVSDWCSGSLKRYSIDDVGLMTDVVVDGDREDVLAGLLVFGLEGWPSNDLHAWAEEGEMGSDV